MTLILAQLVLVFVMAVLFVSSLAGQTAAEMGRQEARLESLRDRVAEIESMRIADRMARVEEGQNMIRQLQYAQLAGIFSLALEVLARRIRKQ